MDEKLRKELLQRSTLDLTKRSRFANHVDQKLKDNIIGQEEALDSIIPSLSCVMSGVRNKEKPVLTLLFLGSTGVGKSECIKVLAEILFGRRDAFTRINCEELSSDFTVSKLFGSPPGYVGNDIEPLLSQNNLNKFFLDAFAADEGIFKDEEWSKEMMQSFDIKKEKCLSLVLFDEIEKAHPKIWTSLLSILDDGHLILSNNEEVDFTNSIIIMTTNVGSKELDQTLRSKSVGFEIDEEEDEQVKLKKIKIQALNSVKEYFPPEFCNRFDRIITFKPLNKEDIHSILQIHLQNVISIMQGAKVPVIFKFKKKFIDKMINEGFSTQYGARELKRVVQKHLVTHLSDLLTTHQLISGDVIEVDVDAKNNVKFIREPRLKTGAMLDPKNIKKPTTKSTATSKKTVAKNKNSVRKRKTT